MGPAMFGVIFYMFHVDLNEGDSGHNATHSTQVFESYTQVSFDKNEKYLLILTKYR